MGVLNKLGIQNYVFVLRRPLRAATLLTDPCLKVILINQM
jgi:hypothetical protein